LTQQRSSFVAGSSDGSDDSIDFNKFVNPAAEYI
jgi:hypothetical protein